MKVELTLPDKPEVGYIADVLKLDPDLVLGKLLRVWRWFDLNTSDGRAHLATFGTVDRLVGIPGFAEAMQFAGWLRQDGKTLVMPAFDRHTSKSAKKRAEDAIRKFKSRTEEPPRTEEMSHNFADKTRTSRGHFADKSVTREEKRREEKEKREEGEECVPTLEEEFSGKPLEVNREGVSGPLEDFAPEIREKASGLTDRLAVRNYGTLANVPGSFKRSKTLYDLAGVLEYFPEAEAKLGGYFDNPTLPRGTPLFKILITLGLEVEVGRKAREPPSSTAASEHLAKIMKQREGGR